MNTNTSLNSQSRPPERRPLELWGGLECTVNRVRDDYFHQLDRNGHATRPADIERFASLGIRAIRYPVIWERTAPDGIDKADWSWPDERLGALRDGRVQILVATDVAARGIDVAGMEAVINVDVSKDPEVHVHRIGRTGRAGESGQALTLAAPNEKKWVRLIEEYQDAPAEWHKLDELGEDDAPADLAPMVTLVISGGKKDKLRPGDVLGALTGDAGLAKDQVGKINVTEFQTYVALERGVAEQAFRRLNAGNRLGPEFGSFKGRSFKMRFLAV